MNKPTDKKARNRVRAANVLEAMKDLGGDTARSVSQDLLKDTSREFIKQLLGIRESQKYSGEMKRGEEVRVDEVMTGKKEANDKARAQIALERKLLEEERVQLETKGRELKLHLHAVIQEVKAVAVATPKLAEEIEVAAFQAPVNPGVYHVIFFEKLLEFIRSFREKVEDAALWLTAVNKRAKKKGFWSQYQAKKGQRLLSAEDYSQRAAA